MDEHDVWLGALIKEMSEPILHRAAPRSNKAWIDLSYFHLSMVLSAQRLKMVSQRQVGRTIRDKQRPERHATPNWSAICAPGGFSR